jgi:predicted nucleic acid-binding protein
MGSALLTEYEAVLGRTDLFARCRLSHTERSELLDIFLSQCEWTRVYFGWRPNVPDESDNHLIELAVAGRASHVVSRNLRDLRQAELSFPGLACVSPEAFIRGVERS